MREAESLPSLRCLQSLGGISFFVGTAVDLKHLFHTGLRTGDKLVVQGLETDLGSAGPRPPSGGKTFCGPCHQKGAASGTHSAAAPLFDSFRY